MKVVFFDTETTGLLKTDASHVSEQPYIIEFYGVVYDNDTWEKLNDFESFVRPPIPISDEITKITGINDGDVHNSPTFLEIYDNVCDLFLGVRRMVGHNLPFDTNMLGNELIRIDALTKFPWPIEHVCTVERSMSVEGYRLTLEKAYAKATNGGTFEGHRARNDVEAMIEVYKWLVKLNLIK